MLSERRLRQIRDWAAESGITDVRLKSNREVVHRVAKAVKEAASDEELYAMLLGDYPAWSACFLDNTKEKPMLLAPWQIEFAAACRTFPMVWTMACRKTGKTAGLAAYAAHKLCLEGSTRAAAFAPTEDQTYVFKMLREMFGRGILRELYIDNGGANLGDQIRLTNNSQIVKHGLALSASRGKYNLGEFGDDFIIDEYQMVPKDVYTSIIQPMRFDVYSEKTTVFIGTADLDANPVLDQQWDEWQKCESCGTLYDGPEDACAACGALRERYALAVDADRGVIEGCVSPDEIRRYKAEATQDEIDMYLYCRFPRQSDRFYDRLALHSVPIGEPFLTTLDMDGFPIPEPGAQYVMAVDWAKEHDRTEVLVADVSTGALHYRYWRRIYPKGEDYHKQREYVKKLFHRMGCRWIIADATSTQDAHIEELTRGDDAISPANFYTDEKERVGYHATGEANAEMHKNHKLNIVNGKIAVSRQGTFFIDWVKQHNQLEKRPVHSGRYIVLEAPRNGYKDLAIVSAMLSLRIRSAGTTPPLMEVGTW